MISFRFFLSDASDSSSKLSIPTVNSRARFLACRGGYREEDEAEETDSISSASSTCVAGGGVGALSGLTGLIFFVVVMIDCQLTRTLPEPPRREAGSRIVEMWGMTGFCESLLHSSDVLGKD